MYERIIENLTTNMFFWFLMYASLRMGIFFWRRGYKHNSFIPLIAIIAVAKLFAKYSLDIFNFYWIFYLPPILLFIYAIYRLMCFVKRDKATEEIKEIQKKLKYVLTELFIVFVLAYWFVETIGFNFF